MLGSSSPGSCGGGGWSVWQPQAMETPTSPPRPHLQLLQLEAEVDEPHHRVLLPLRVLGQRQDRPLALLDGLAQLLHIWCQDQALRQQGEQEEGGSAAPHPPALLPPRPHSPRGGRSGPRPAPGPGCPRGPLGTDPAVGLQGGECYGGAGTTCPPPVWDRGHPLPPATGQGWDTGSPAMGPGPPTPPATGQGRGVSTHLGRGPPRPGAPAARGPC